MVVGETEVPRALGKPGPTGLPGFPKIGGRLSFQHHAVQRVVQGPVIIQIKGLGQVGRILRFRQQKKSGVGLIQGGAGLFPEIHRHKAGGIASKSIHLRLFQPVAHDLDHGLPCLGLGVVQRGHILPSRLRMHHLPLAVFTIKIGILHPLRIPSRVVGHEIQNHFQSQPVGRFHQLNQIFF